MPKLSAHTAPQVQDFGLGTERGGDLDGYTVNFVSIRQGHSLDGMFKGLPGDACPCPHWGYLLAGQITVRYADHEEVIEAGDAFYMPPGHVPEAASGTEIIQFSPATELAAVKDVMAANMSPPVRP
jgi:hypothetical protein